MESLRSILRPLVTVKQQRLRSISILIRLPECWCNQICAVFREIRCKLLLFLRKDQGSHRHIDTCHWFWNRSHRWPSANRVEHGKKFCKRSLSIAEERGKELICDKLDMSAFDKQKIGNQVDIILVHSDGSLQIELKHTEYFNLLPNWGYLCGR